MRHYSLYIFDLDGTLYRGSEALPDSVSTIAALKGGGAIVRYLTNNSSQTPTAQCRKLRQMGFDCSPEEILTSGVGAGRYLREAGMLTAFVVGEDGLVEVLANEGIVATQAQDTCDAVVVGICRQFSYSLLEQAMVKIRTGAQFIATNTDSTYPLEKGRLIPGAGAIVAAVRTCSGAEPLVIGKPETRLVDMILAETGARPADTLMVGDRFETDIVAGRNAGCDTAMVLTGVTREAPVGQFCVRSLAELLS